MHGRNGQGAGRDDSLLAGDGHGTFGVDYDMMHHHRSGFGASAVRVGWRDDRRVLVLERGDRYPPGPFRADPGVIDERLGPEPGLYGLFDVWSFRAIRAVVSSGLGGGSLIYANVMIRKPEEGSSETTGDNAEYWPISYDDPTSPHPGGTDVRGTTYPYSDTTPKTVSSARLPRSQPRLASRTAGSSVREPGNRRECRWVSARKSPRRARSTSGVWRV